MDLALSDDGQAESYQFVRRGSAEKLVLIDFRRFSSGDVKATIAEAVRSHFGSNDVR